MFDLHINPSKTTDEYRQILADLGVTLPLHPDPDDLGVIIDANGRDVATVDVEKERSDAAADQITTWIILAVNTCGGFQLKAKIDG